MKLGNAKGEKKRIGAISKANNKKLEHQKSHSKELM